MSHWPPVSFAGKSLMFTVGVSFPSVLGSASVFLLQSTFFSLLKSEICPIASHSPFKCKDPLLQWGS